MSVFTYCTKPKSNKSTCGFSIVMNLRTSKFYLLKMSKGCMGGWCQWTEGRAGDNLPTYRRLQLWSDLSVPKFCSETE